MAAALSFISVLVGVFLVIAPWTRLWELNYLLGADPLLRRFLLSPFLRGAVSGLGLVNVALAAYEVWLHLGGHDEGAPR